MNKELYVGKLKNGMAFQDLKDLDNSFFTQVFLPYQSYNQAKTNGVEKVLHITVLENGTVELRAIKKNEVH